MNPNTLIERLNTLPGAGNSRPSLPDLLDNNEAAQLLQCSPNYMRLSRHTGLLFGVPAPAFLKMGRKVRYRRETLLSWLAQFDEKPNTAAC